MNRWEVIAGLLKDSEPLIGAEIGVKNGRFIQHLLSQFSSLEMYAVDPWEPQPFANESYVLWDFDDIYTEYQSRIEPYRLRVREMRMYSHDAVHHIPDKALDFVFIDAQHDYGSVVTDITAWAPKVKPGGLLSGHDYNKIKFPGVCCAVEELVDGFEVGDNDTWFKWI